MEKSITLNHVGYTVCGTAILSLWGGGQGSIEMQKVFIPKNKLSKETLLGCVNDSQFGCEEIEEVVLVIYETYERNVTVYKTEITLDSKACKKYQHLFFKYFK